MSTAPATPPRGTQFSSAALYAFPSSPVPRRPGGTPTSSFASPSLRGTSSPLSRRCTPQLPPPPRSLQPSMDRYVSAPSRQNTSMAHFLLTSTEQKTPMLIRAAQQHQLALRSPSREPLVTDTSFDDAYASPTRYAVDLGASSGGGAAASPRPHSSLPRAGSARLSSVFAKMHLDPSVRSSRDRSASAASVAGEAAVLGGLGGGSGDDDASSPPPFSFVSSPMDLEPYTSKLARTLFNDMPQTTVLSVNDTSTRPTVAPPPPPPPTTTAAAASAATTASAAAFSASSTLRSSVRTPATPMSPDVSDPTVHFASARSDDSDVHCNEEEADNDEDGYCYGRQHNENYGSEEEGGDAARRRASTANEEGEADVCDAENRCRRGAALGGGGGLFGLGRIPLASSDVNLGGMSEGERYDASLGVVFECNRARNFTSPSFRVIPNTPERILDAADMEDDFYMNLIDWSVASDVLCVALQSCVYLWDAKTCGITELPRAPASAFGDSRSPSAQLVCGLNWAPSGYHLAVGRNSGVVEVWDVEAQKMVHSYRQHTDRTVSLSWEPQGGTLLASGSRDSTVVLRDVRERDTSSSSSSSPYASTSSLASATSVLQGHETEVCGLKWSPTGAMLASGGNDNQLLVWDRRKLATGGGGGRSEVSSSSNGGGGSGAASSTPYPLANSPQPLFYLNKHTAAVKALSWNPSQPALLVSGGGSHDKSLRFWSTLTGECVHHINTGSQVCGVVWNRTGTELVTAHGYTDNQLSIWRYPSLRRIANLIGHTSRVLHLALSADGETVVSAAADETLRFWRCFPPSELRESSPHLYRSFYSPSSASSVGASPFAGGGNPAVGGSATRTRAGAIAAGRCRSASEDRDGLSFMSEEVELR
ncbi:cell division cycle protein 20 putative (CDC20) [Leptomonas pyrrhocoris]|uniref:Cell division cycle protein 20 putative (CDC20) n=1 Tax=Leptomonas pyrrhocoris TaxID=157538 RepID=A0A0M9FZD7_LEPPY|nr:cell division cycle protein 20 putative (CDC20) [Leptomonas pyrrhocoris]XP_015657700.1 cell division cycle protein 20 putative (CDC20) [Leptomonas pyrrhocoris]KPA79260.1 cell division cycle protein 20 putative (CDC20) [Leptomonas pyrrhocoris]KPA79261.1 cell division cycle protein 20 putative (CDC20) [Leptomonas pyrrhocoris]|eukprot:XP_015657699.1 cell division cycle protein 20 putative (CDC20) [Leptomonas pyrrhocoris]